MGYLITFNNLRKVCLLDVPGVFSKTMEVDETYLGGQKKNKTKKQLLKDKLAGKESKKGFGTTKQAVFGILCRSDKVFAKLVDNAEDKILFSTSQGGIILMPRDFVIKR